MCYSLIVTPKALRSPCWLCPGLEPSVPSICSGPNHSGAGTHHLYDLLGPSGWSLSCLAPAECDACLVHAFHQKVVSLWLAAAGWGVPQPWFSGVGGQSCFSKATSSVCPLTLPLLLASPLLLCTLRSLLFLSPASLGVWKAHSLYLCWLWGGPCVSSHAL